MVTVYIHTSSYRFFAWGWGEIINAGGDCAMKESFDPLTLLLMQSGTKPSSTKCTY